MYTSREGSRRGVSGACVGSAGGGGWRIGRAPRYSVSLWAYHRPTADAPQDTRACFFFLMFPFLLVTRSKVRSPGYGFCQAMVFARFNPNQRATCGMHVLLLRETPLCEFLFAPSFEDQESASLQSQLMKKGMPSLHRRRAVCVFLFSLFSVHDASGMHGATVTSFEFCIYHRRALRHAVRTRTRTPTRFFLLVSCFRSSCRAKGRSADCGSYRAASSHERGDRLGVPVHHGCRRPFG